MQYAHRCRQKVGGSDFYRHTFLPDSALWYQAFRLGLSQHGWVEGKNIRIEYRYAEGMRDRVPQLATELIRLDVEVIVASIAVDAVAAQKASTTIPIVVAAAGDPVASGLAESLARPGSNVTGLSQMTFDLVGKRLELLKEMVPNLSRVAVLRSSGSQSGTLSWKELQLPARQFGLQLHSLEVSRPSDFDKAFDDAIAARAGAVFIVAAPVIVTNLKKTQSWRQRAGYRRSFSGRSSRTLVVLWLMVQIAPICIGAPLLSSTRSLGALNPLLSRLNNLQSSSW